MDMMFKNSRWRMHRMGLVDFWYYLNEEFYFEDGHMLLRGSNGSGKSVTLQSIIPLLLDGNKSSERLDSFGSRARKMETYLIDEESDRNDRIGYLYLEFKRDDSDIYKTIGMGLRARKNKPLDSWYFVIEDNRRINYDIKLIDHNLTISKQSLKNLIGDQLIEHQKEYVNRVNKALFGFKNLEDYKETINLLVQLRSPKLSNSLKPTMINEILSNSLQPLSEEDLRPMSEAITNLDEIEDQLEILKQSYQSAKVIFNYYDQYNYACLDYKANLALNDLHILNDNQKMIDQINDDKTKNIQSLNDSKEHKALLINENSILNDELKVIANPELFKLSEDLVDKKAELNHKTQQYHDKLNQENSKNDKYLDEKSILKKHEDKKANISHNIDNIFKELDDIQTHIEFDEHYALKEALFENMAQEYDYAYVFNKIDSEIKELNNALHIFSKIEKENIIVDRIVNEIEMKEYEIQNINDDLAKYKKMLDEAIEAIIEAFAIWNENNQYLKLNSDNMLMIIDILQNYDEEDNFYKIDDVIYQEYIELTRELINKKTKLETSLEDLKHQKLILESELHRLENLEDVVPEINEYTLENRKYLDEAGIKYRPFYTLLEFSDDLSDDLKNNFEEMLKDMGLLNALVVSENNRYQVLKVKEGLADKYLFTDKDIDDLNICYLDEDVDINMILDSLGIDDSGIMLIGDIYQNGIITGTISKKEKSVYIGKLSREKYRLKMIEEINASLKELNERLDSLYNELLIIDEKIKTLDNERNKYPNKNHLDDLKQAIYLKERHIEQISKLISENKQDLSIHRKNIYDMNLEVTNISNRLSLNCLKETYENRKEYFDEYQKELSELKTLHISYIATYELYLNSQIILDNLEKDLDVIRYEKDILDNTIKKLNMEIASIQRQLQEAGFSDKKERIEIIQKRLKDIVDEISYQDRMMGNLEMAIEQNDKDIITYESKISLAKDKYESSYNAYLEEAELRYVNDDILDIDKVHAIIYDKYPKLNKKESILNDFQTSFHTNKGSLNEYRLNLISIFKDSDNERIDITARYKGFNIKFKDLILKLEEDIDEQKLLFDDRDRYLVEDILVNTLSSKIRQHIQNSRRWIEKMNQYMNSMKTSSGLNLSLKWHSHQGLNDDELNSDELVKLLEKDPAILRGSDFKRLSSHFRSKIKTARQLTEMEDNQYSFHQIMKNIMDYRTWFDFEIWYQKKGENKKELTNNAFFAFSGGEKAMAMYIPLFSAVAAKYDQAGDDTPMIIALDEAFAGVDEKNINNLFGLIDKFKFDYIMNSQVLWGDYPSVKALAIHELFRPENAHFVTVITYKWNGKTKKMVEDIWM